MLQTTLGLPVPALVGCTAAGQDWDAGAVWGMSAAVPLLDGVLRL